MAGEPWPTRSDGRTVTPKYAASIITAASTSNRGRECHQIVIPNITKMSVREAIHALQTRVCRAAPSFCITGSEGMSAIRLKITIYVAGNATRESHNARTRTRKSCDGGSIADVDGAPGALADAREDTDAAGADDRAGAKQLGSMRSCRTLVSTALVIRPRRSPSGPTVDRCAASSRLRPLHSIAAAIAWTRPGTTNTPAGQYSIRLPSMAIAPTPTMDQIKLYMDCRRDSSPGDTPVETMLSMIGHPTALTPLYASSSTATGPACRGPSAASGSSAMMRYTIASSRAWPSRRVSAPAAIAPTM